MTSSKGAPDHHYLRDVVLNPSKSVTYRPIPNKQMAEVTVTNNEATPIIFKWKSTRPGMYKMRPVYGALAPGDKADIHLFCRGVKDIANTPTTDRYTCVVAATPTANVNAENIWSNHKYQEKLAGTGKLRKIKLAIVYLGINDKDEGAEEEDEKDRTGKIRDKKKDKETRKKATLLMFTRKEGDSASGEDDGHEEACATTVASKNLMDLLKPVKDAGVFQNQPLANIPQPIVGFQPAAAPAAKASQASHSATNIPIHSSGSKDARSFAAATSPGGIPPTQTKKCDVISRAMF